MDENINRLFTELTAAYANFIQVANQLDGNKRYQAGVCGEWSPKDVISHLVGWDQSLKALIVAPDEFEPPYEVDNFNARSVASRKDLDWAAVIDEMETNFEELRQALALVKPEMPIYRRVISWLPGRREDYELHTRQLEAWLG
ncbi:MAG: maleylpyruvate isomerase N-terminal domain-containing protein [Anaerolineaceae bacterium]|nr:maleylpyruvate isomerase N-terminal domain-containing protein [Anaerolineaceae bacterium]MCB9099116.1 maleylpyruvate isomerase N-terminal domain-containing protein [Anaerolineales bacterium]